jgi:hypothetical protein
MNRDTSYFLEIAIVVLIFAIIRTLYLLLNERGMDERFLKTINRAQVHIERELKQFGLQLIEIKEAKTGDFFRWPPKITFYTWGGIQQEPKNSDITEAKVVFKNKYGKIGEVYVEIMEEVLDGKTNLQFSPGLEKFEYADEDIRF